MTICIPTEIIYTYIVITYILGLLLHFAKFIRNGRTDAHDLLNLVISPVYIVVLIAFGVASYLFPSKFR